MALLLRKNVRAASASFPKFQHDINIKSDWISSKSFQTCRLNQVFSLSLRAHMGKRGARGSCADRGGKAPKGQSAWGETIYSSCKQLIFHNWGLKIK